MRAQDAGTADAGAGESHDAHDAPPAPTLLSVTLEVFIYDPAGRLGAEPAINLPLDLHHGITFAEVRASLPLCMWLRGEGLVGVG